MWAIFLSRSLGPLSILGTRTISRRENIDICWLWKYATNQITSFLFVVHNRVCRPLIHVHSHAFVMLVLVRDYVWSIFDHWAMADLPPAIYSFIKKLDYSTAWSSFVNWRAFLLNSFCHTWRYIFGWDHNGFSVQSACFHLDGGNHGCIHRWAHLNDLIPYSNNWRPFWRYVYIFPLVAFDVAFSQPLSIGLWNSSRVFKRSLFASLSE